MEDNSTKRSKNFSKQELEVLVEEEEFKEGWTLETTAVCSCYSRLKRILWWNLIFFPTKLELHPPKLLYPLKSLYPPPHIELEVQQNNSEEDLVTLSQLISESILQPTPVTTHSMEDMIFIQGDLLEEVWQLRRVQEQLQETALGQSQI
ncbi:unnamed protein product [Gadus morhua 'NCC']